MTFQELHLLLKLKKAQIIADGVIGIDMDDMTAVTVHQTGQKYKTVSLKVHRRSLSSALSHLEKQGYIEDLGNGIVRVTYTGWYIFSATVAGAVKFTIRDVLIPIIAAVATTVIVNFISR